MSGGLDSTLAAKIIKDLGFEVRGVNFYNGFCIEKVHLQVGRSYCYTPLNAAGEIGVELRTVDISDEYLEVVKHPKWGRGSAMNPCLDCRIFMLKKAKGLMKEIGAEFVITGEVLGQRPMSQYYKAMLLVQKESGLGERLLRPLCGKLLPPTYPEKMGWLKREDLLDIRGRSRKRQLELARKYGLTKYSSPAGGCCLLVEKRFGDRLRDLFKHKEELKREDFELLKVGRHFRLSKTKLIIGRNKGENCFLEQFKGGRWCLEVEGFMGPVALIDGNPSKEEFELAAKLIARYSDGKDSSWVSVILQKDDELQKLKVRPLRPDDEVIKRTLI
jgi:tRNA U34 2-thiouridine synthase MnmA/TrmU